MDILPENDNVFSPEIPHDDDAHNIDDVHGHPAEPQLTPAKAWDKEEQEGRDIRERKRKLKGDVNRLLDGEPPNED